MFTAQPNFFRIEVFIFFRQPIFVAFPKKLDSQSIKSRNFVCNFVDIYFFFYVLKLQKLFDMAKPRLGKVEALFYIMKHLAKIRVRRFDTPSFCVGSWFIYG